MRLTEVEAAPNGSDCHHEHNGTEAPACAQLACAQPLMLEKVIERFQREAERSTCDTGRYRCPYYAWGSGPPLVFVHGLCDDAMSFALPIARLSEHFRCIAYDLPAGRADGARLSTYRHESLVADLFALLDHLKLTRATLFGSSFGSTIALSALHQQPERFPKAILQGGFARRPLARAEVMLASWARYWPWNMDRLPFRLSVLQSSHARCFPARAPEIWRFFLERDGGNPMKAVARRALMLHRTDIRHLLRDITQPILMVCGEFDPLVGKGCEEELLVGLPNVVRAEIEGSGHMPQFTHPEVLAELVHQFIRS